jgi:hypothetical protein
MILRALPLALLLTLAACSAPAPQGSQPQTAEPGAGQPAAAPTPQPPSATTLTLNGLGPVQLGMRVQEAEQALHARFAPMEPEESEACWTAWRGDGADPQVSYMVEDGRVTRLDIGDSDANPASTVKTAEGIGIGAAERDVLAAYGPATKVQPHKYDESGHYLVVDSPDARSALVFETSNGMVTTFRAGFHPSVDYVEGCL